MDGDVETLLKGIEAAFDVQLTGRLGDESSLGDVLAAVQTQLVTSKSERCLTSIAFWRLRRSLIDVAGVARTNVKPYADLSALLPPVRRRSAWRRIGKTMGLRLPGLEYGPVPSHLILFGAMAMTVSTVFLAMKTHWLAVFMMVPLVFAALLLSSNALFHLLRPLAVKIPSHSLLAGDAAKSIVGLNHAILAKEYGPAGQKELWESLRYVVMDLTGADQSRIQPDTHILDLVEDASLRAPV